ncbi:hypothetical protein NP233_g345 [Leucocoprinus birnbaumii]|uniref:DUF7918 domain-containing protein n=1 Tax=Leucocoprinus birnbaumii TaxID=56174 RepID=A0AAD5W1Y9_9AGAR|nr:hypothetical protein NP233_g345 [Leucocoprinus birnbaumii]
MPILDGFSATMRVDGVDLPEFRIERDLERRRISCWVPSQPDKEFGVIVNSGSRARGPWVAGVLADGVRAYSTICLTDQSCNVGFFQKSSTVKCPFSFAKVDLVDDDALLHTIEATRIGEIEISCYLVEVTNSYFRPEYSNAIADNSRVHEKSKKGLSEHVGFKKEIESTQPCRFYTTQTIEFIGTFVFRYRPLAWLQAERIAPTKDQVIPVVDFARLPYRSSATASSSTSVTGDGTEEKPLVISDTEDSDDEVTRQRRQPPSPSKRKRAPDHESQAKKAKTEAYPVDIIDLT